MDGSSGIHPGELSRRISELEISTLNRPSTTEQETGLHFTTDELNSPRPNQENRNGNSTLAGGILTPPEVPAPPPSPYNELASSDGALADIDTNAKALDGEQTKKKKKKSGKNKKPNPTGFEEFFADAPITPGEFEEEQDLYDPSIPFHERIQTCIQRFRKRRNLDSTRSNIFTKYLMLGGIEGSTVKPFSGGLDQDVVDNSTAQELVAIQATDHIRTGHNNAKFYDPANRTGWVVDFEGIGKGFFSSAVFKHFNISTEQGIKNVCGVVRNFLNYLLRHAVCLEYTDDILAARLICDLAEKELMAMENLRGKLPGPFNLTASHLYGKRFLEKSGDNKLNTGNEITPRNERLQAQAARRDRIFKTGVAFEGASKMFCAVENDKVLILKTSEKRYIEVVQIDRARQSTIEKYASLEDHEGNVGNLLPLGKVHIKCWDGPGHFTEDLTEEEEAGPIPSCEPQIDTLWVEDSILEHFFLGMKMEVETTELDIGLTLLEEVHGLFCSFYTLLPNEKMLDNWKEPVPNNRPPPTEDNPDAEEEGKDRELN